MIMFGYDVFGAPHKSFAASISGFSNTPSTISLYDLLRDAPEAKSNSKWPSNWAYDSAYLVSDDDYLGNNSDHPDDDDIAELFYNYNQSTMTNADRVILYNGDAFEFEAEPGTVAKFRIMYVNNAGGKAKTPYNYVVNIKKNKISVPTACNSSSYPAWSNYQERNTSNSQSGYARFTVELDGDTGSYFGIDMDNTSSNVHASRFKTADGTWQTTKGSPESEGLDRVEIQLISITKKPVRGCTDSTANNYDSNATVDNGGCTYDTTTISSFSATPTTVKVGEPITLTWVLADSNFSKVGIIHNGKDLLAGTGQEQDQSSSFTFTPTVVGNNSFKLQVTWNKPNAATRSQNKSVSVQSATSYIQCTDSNRAKDGNGECADCNSGYYLDSTTGLCSQCSDPNRRKNADGSCGDCNAGYEIVDGICQESANDCSDSNREKNSDGSCASSCKSGYSFDDSNMCVSTDTTSSESSGFNWGLIGVVGVLAAVSVVAIK